MSAVECPTWLAHLERTLPDPVEREWFAAWVRRLVAGESKREIVVFVGDCASGKSVTTNVLRQLLGDDAVLQVATNSLKRSLQCRDRVNGRWMVVAEVDDDDEMPSFFDLVNFTNSHTVSARANGGQAYRYAPEMAFVLHTYTKYWIETIIADDAIDWATILHFAPLAADEMDRDLPKKLDAEMPAIRAWAGLAVNA